MKNTSESSFSLSIELSLPSELGYEKIARDAVGAFAHRIGFAEERVEDLKTALSEACINAIEHGNRRAPELRVWISCSYQDECLAVIVADQGQDPVVTPERPATMSEKVQGQASARGMGLSLIACLVDEAEFLNQSGGAGNVFRIAIRKQAADTAASG